MGRPRTEIGELERRALLGIWSIPGIGARSLDALYDRLGGLGEHLEHEPSRWLPKGLLSAAAEARLLSAAPLAALAEWTSKAVEAGGFKVTFSGDPEYPRNLVEVDTAPPLLFYQGELSPPRRRVAMVGSRHPDGGFAEFAQRFARDVARRGMGVISGAADGVDRACHVGALEAGQETWAFLGSALDALDGAQASLLPAFLAGAGVFYSEFPPGVRACQATFPRRNRLIAGAADVVLVLRAGATSGALHTANYAREQGRPLLAIPGDPGNACAFGTNALLRDHGALVCLHPLDVLSAAGLTGDGSEQPAPAAKEIDWSGVSSQARSVYTSLAGVMEFEQMLASASVSSGELTSALCELELLGLVVQRPGKRYERI